MSSLDNAPSVGETMKHMEGVWSLKEHKELPFQDQMTRVLMLNKVAGLLVSDGREVIVSLLDGRNEDDGVWYTSKAKAVKVGFSRTGTTSEGEQLEFKVEQFDGKKEVLPFEFSKITIDTWESKDFPGSLVVDFVGNSINEKTKETNKRALRVMIF